MASYHLSVKSVSRGAGRSAVAAAAYRAGCRLACEREGRVHDYGRKRGVEAALIVAPESAPEWATDRERLWNAAEAAENRKNSVVAREWELALPAELEPERRRAVVTQFARALVARYGVAVDVAIHAPHREGDQRNHHAHVLATTRALGAEGLGAKTRVLDAQATRGAEVTAMRTLWAGLQNDALERAEAERGLDQGTLDRVDHRSLAARREEALERGEPERAEVLDRAPEVKLGPAVSALERRAAREAEQKGREYAPVTDRGAQVHEARTARALFAEVRAGLEAASERAVELAEAATRALREAAERLQARREAARARAAEKRERERTREAEQARAREAAVEACARLFETALLTADTLAGLAPSRDVVAPLRAAEAELEARLPAEAARLGMEPQALVDAVAERAAALRQGRRTGMGLGREAEAQVRADARERFVEANARAWDAALWGLDREAARQGVEAAALQDEREFARERERIADRLEHAAIRFGEPQGVLQGALQARSDALDAAAGPERAAALGRIADARAAEEEAELARELARVQARLDRLAEEAAALRAGLEAQHAEQAARAEAERRAEAEAQAQAEAQARARSCAALRGLAAGLDEEGWRGLRPAERAALRLGLDEHLERAVGREGVARLDAGDHEALEGVLGRPEDRIALTQARLFEAGERLGREELMERGRRLFMPLLEAQLAREDAELERRRSLGLDLGDELDDRMEM